MNKVIAKYIAKLARKNETAFHLAMRQMDSRLPMLYNNYHNAGYSTEEALELAVSDLVDRDADGKA